MKTILITQSGFCLKHKLLNKIFLTAFYFAISYTVFAQDAETYYNQGLAKETDEKYKEAILLFDKAIALKADFALAWMDRGNCKDELGLFKEAIADYDQSIKLNPSYKDAWFNRGYSKYDFGDLRGAITDFTYVIEHDPKDGEAYHSRGFAYADLGNADSACADFQRAVDLGIEDAKEDLALCNASVSKDSIVMLDTTVGQARLVARGPVVKNIGKDTTYGIFFIVMPPGTGVFGVRCKL